MEILILSIFTAFAKIFLFTALLGGVRKMLWWSKAIDIFVLLVLPWLFYGTFSGVVLAIFSGLWITLILATMKTFLKPLPPAWLTKLRHERTNRHRASESRGLVVDCRV